MITGRKSSSVGDFNGSQARHALTRFLLIILVACWSALAADALAEDWLLQEAAEVELYAVYPLRDDRQRVADVRYQRLDLRDGRNQPVTDFGFSLRVDRENFRFNSSRIERFYLRPWNLFWTEGRSLRAFTCSDNFFSARVAGQEESVGRNFNGYQDHYPKGVWFRAAHVQEISVLGETRLRTEYRPVEIWGFANSRANAQHMANFYKERIRNAVFHEFRSNFYRSESYSFAGEKLGDQVRGEIIRRYEETQDMGRPFRRRPQLGVESITVRVNGRSRFYSVELRGFQNPGRREFEIDGRRVFVDLGVHDRGNTFYTARAWIAYRPPSGEWPPLADLGVFISKCDR